MTPHPVLKPRTRTPGSRDRRLSGLIAAAAVRALLEELATWPKPGLVSHVDNGSHDDMDAAMLQRSAEVLGPFFEELAQAGSDHDSMASLRAIGLRAEVSMLTATGGVNTHRGTIFGLGLLCAAAGLKAARSLDDNAARQQTLGAIVSQHRTGAHRRSRARRNLRPAAARDERSWRPPWARKREAIQNRRR
jgi:triphosphoribosyl-dephospho-CoA synthase